jgi:WbqC-like protein family
VTHIAVMQPYLFPYLGYYQLVYHVSEFVFFDDVHFIKRGYIHRNNILMDGEARLFSLPVDHASQNRLIKDHVFLDRSSEVESLIEHTYRNAPNFSHIYPLVREVLRDPDRSVVNVTSRSIMAVFDYLGLKKCFSLSSEVEKSASARGQQKIIDICLAKGAHRYTNAIGGKQLYEPAVFAGRGIALEFIRMHSVTYQQSAKTFVPNLSMIDILMHCCKEEVVGLLEEYSVEGAGLSSTAPVASLLPAP